jgi:Fe-S oxidoreductase
LQKKTARLEEIGAGAVVTSCPGCYMQLKENLDIPVHFFSDLFDRQQLSHNGFANCGKTKNN